MQNYFTTSVFWPWRRQQVALPKHLPRLLLKKRQQPRFVRRCQVTQRTCVQLRLLDWGGLPLSITNKRTGWRTIPLAAYVGAYLVKLDNNLTTFGKLHRFLREHPALVWALGFPLVPDKGAGCGFHIEASLPTQRQLSRKLSELPNELLQNLLDSQVAWLQKRLGTEFGQTIALDTKHILAWVKENNPKAYVKNGRFNGDQQPAGDKDCKVGCKKRQNQVTPTKEGQPATKKVSSGQYYWGYASGIVVTKEPEIGEFVLAETTKTFDDGDVKYFFPLMSQVEERLGFRPTYAALDAAFDAFYVYDYFHSPDSTGFAAVPLRELKQGVRKFDEAGLPLCEAGLAMPLKQTFTRRSALVQHECGRYACPLLYPNPNGESCRIEHPKWEDGGCLTTLPTAAGARIRYQLDRESESYKRVYAQRTATERIFSQAVNLGMERPKLRNEKAITNFNSLIYILINLRAMERAARQLVG